MANQLLIEKQTGGYFKFTLNNDSANAITSIQNDLLAVGSQLHFKTGNGANIIKEQFIYPEDVTIISGGVFTFTTVAGVWDKLIEIDYFAWLGGGGDGVDRFDDLLDTFQYNGNAGKVAVVDNAETKLVPITLYNKRLFTELEDTPSDLVPDKMVVVNPAGTALILQDQPEPPEQYLNSVGYFDYEDFTTSVVPLSATNGVAKKLTNDTEGVNTSTDQNPYGVSFVWDFINNQFNFSELTIGDTIDVRIHITVTTTTSNQKVEIKSRFGIGSASQFETVIYDNVFKSSGTHEISFVAPFYLGSLDIINSPAELYLTTDANATIRVYGWYVRILRKNINIITVDYEVPDATTLIKGILRLGGDLSGTANNPTVPELANKVPNSRVINTTSPLLGGGNLGSDLTLSMQQANSVLSGFLSFGDWTTFNNKQNYLSGSGIVKSTSGVISYLTDNSDNWNTAYNDKINTASVTGTTTKTLTLTQQDGSTITADWTDNNDDSVTSVFGRTGDVIAVSGDYTTSLVTEGSNLYYTEARVSANADVSANTAKRHDAATIGTANGLSLSGQELSLGLSSGSTTGALSSTDWTTFNNKVPSSRTITINGESYDLSANRSWTIDGGVTSVFGRTGDVVAVSGDYTTSLVTEGSNLYFTNARSRSAISLTTTGTSGSATYDSATGVLNIPNYEGGITLGTPNGLSLSGQELSLGLSSGSANGALSSTDWTTFNNKQPALNGTGFVKVTGTTVSYDNSTYVPTSRTININGNEFDLSANRAWSIPTHNAVSIGSANGLSITSDGQVLSLALASAGSIGALSASDWMTFNSKIGGSGTANYLPKFTGSAFLGNSQIFDNGTNVGIGTDSPGTKLDVRGNINIGNASDTVTNSFAIQSNKAIFSIAANGGTNAAGTTITYTWGAGGQGPLIFNRSLGVETMRLGADGNVGIGTTTPATLLYVKGNSLYNGNITADNSSTTGGGVFTVRQNGVTSGFMSTAGSVLGNTSRDLALFSETGLNQVFFTNDTERLRITSGGNVGIGTTSPTEKFIVAGSGRFTGQATNFSTGSRGVNIDITDASGLSRIYAVAGTGTAGDLALGTDGAERMRITSGGNVGIGTTSPGYALDVNGIIRSTGLGGFAIGNTGGIPRIQLNNGNTFTFFAPADGLAPIVASSFNTSSDYRLKEDLKSINGLDLVSKIKVYDYKWKSDETRAYGVLAHELQEVIPQAVNGEKDGEQMQGVDYSKLVPILVQAIQELKAEIETLKNK
jgi:hypothetical protein